MQTSTIALHVHQQLQSRQWCSFRDSENNNNSRVRGGCADEAADAALARLIMSAVAASEADADAPGAMTRGSSGCSPGIVMFVMFLGKKRCTKLQ